LVPVLEKESRHAAPPPRVARAERKEEEARKLEQNLKFMVAKKCFMEAAELYYAYRLTSRQPRRYFSD